MREVGGGRTRSYWISFILSVVSLWIVFVYSLLGPGIPLTEYAHSQGSAALTEHAHTQGQAYQGFQQRLRHAHTQGQIFRGQRKWTITSRFKVNICTWLIFGRTPTECLILWMESFYLLMLCGPTQEKKCPLLWCSHLGDLSDSFHPPWASFFLICTTACSRGILLGENHTLLGVECH